MAAHTTQLRLKASRHSGMKGLSRRGRDVQMDQASIPLYFHSTRGSMAAATLELVLQREDGTEHIIGTYTIHVQAKDGAVRLIEHKSVANAVDPLFVSKLVDSAEAAASDDSEDADVDADDI